jgi:hypothetical protein
MSNSAASSTSSAVTNGNTDALKTSVYSQFPSISSFSSPEEVLRLQNLITENAQLKLTLEKVNNSMRAFYNNSLQWHEKMNNMKQQLSNCHKEIQMLRDTNIDLLEKQLLSSFEVIDHQPPSDKSTDEVDNF